MPYNSIKAINWSSLRHMRVSPKYYKHMLDNPRLPTAAMTLGTCVHLAVLQPERFTESVVVYGESKTKGHGARSKWQAFEKAHENHTILSERDYRSCINMRDAIHNNTDAVRYFESISDVEVPVVWNHKKTGRMCKSKIDAITTEHMIIELKTTRDIGERRFKNDCASLGYYGQLAFYHDAIATELWKPVNVITIAVENTPPYDVAVYHMHQWLVDGRMLYESLLDRVIKCERIGIWPGKVPTERALSVPEYVLSDNDDLICDDGTV